MCYSCFCAYTVIQKIKDCSYNLVIYFLKYAYNTRMQNKTISKIFYRGPSIKGNLQGACYIIGGLFFSGSFEVRKPQGGHLNQGYQQENLLVMKIKKCKQNQNAYFWKVSFYKLFIFYTLGVFLSLSFGFLNL